MPLDRLITPERARFIRFCVVGASGVVVNLGVFSLIFYLVLGDQMPDPDRRLLVSNAVGIAVSIFTNFLLNDYWTWGDREKVHGHFGRRLGKFYLVSSIAAAVQLGVAQVMHANLDLHEQLSVLIGIAVATVINFAANNIWTFRATSSD